MIAHTTLLALFAFQSVIFPQSADAVTLDLRATLNKNGKTLALIASPSEAVSQCSMEIHSSQKRSDLQSLNSNTLILEDTTNNGGSRGYTALKLRPLNASIKESALYLRARLRCEAEEVASNIVKVTPLKNSKGIRSVRGWISHLANKLVPHTIAISDAFPNVTFENPVDLQHAADGSNRLFIVEQSGKIYSIANKRSVQSKTLFLDVSSKIKFGGERGLLGLAFHPKFKENGYFYLHYSKADTGDTVIARYKTNGGRTNGILSSEFIILEQAQPFANHNGGQITFGKDGNLYIALGDGGSAGDPQGNGQNLSTLLGKILRINIDRKSSGKNYSIPASNPFRNNANGYREEIFAYGLRNPWRMSFDRKNGTLWAADVGQNTLEEVNIIQSGKNYGWKTMEGNQCYNATSCEQSGLTLPITQYGRSLGRSISGGLVYRGSASTALTGLYIFGDFVSGRIWSVDGSGNSSAMSELADTDHFISSFGSDEAGEIYFLSYYSGKILSIR